MDQQTTGDSSSAAYSNNTDSLETKNQQPWVERNGFAHWAMAIAWVVVALVLFNIVGAVAGIIGVLATTGITDVAEVMEQMQTNYDIIFLANTAGQVLVFGLATLVIVKMHAIKGKRKSFLRMQLSPNVWKVSLLSVLLFIAVQPVILLLGWINSFLPVPEVFEQLQQTMADTITNYLKSDSLLLMGVFYLGVVPAVCEEIMYRGYVMRSLEKKWGMIAAILISGVIFGMYHIQPSNVLPLSALGILLAYVTYASNSLVPAMLAHLVNNGGQVIASSYYPEMLEQEMTPDMQLPWGLIVISVIISSGILYLLKGELTKEGES